MPTFHAWKVCIISKMFFHNFLFCLKLSNISGMLNVRLVFTTPFLRHMQWPISLGTMYVRGDTNDIDLLMVFLLAQNIVLSTVSTPLELPHFYFLFSFTFFLPFLLTFLTFWWCKQCAVNCVNTLGALWLCLDLWDSAPQERNLGRPSCGIYCLSRLFVYLLAMSENGKVFLLNGLWALLLCFGQL